MLNKKAIAAFAAGATLLAGFAMSAPAFAEECTPATAAELYSAQKAIDDDLDSIRTEQKTLSEKRELLKAAKKHLNELQSALDKATSHAKAKKAEAELAKTNYEKALAAYYANPKTKDADRTKDKFDASETGSKLVEALKKANMAYYGAEVAPEDPANYVATSLAGKLATAQKALDDYKTGAYADAEQAVKDAQKDVDDAKKQLKADKDDLAKLQCKKTDSVKPGKPGQPNKPGKPGKPGKPNKGGVHINTKGTKGKKQLSKTGVGVAFAALAAAMLAGMGAAVRKIRH